MYISKFLTRNKATFITVITFSVGAVGFFNDGFDLIKNHFVQKHAEDGLENINTGVSIKHVVSIFGPPIAESKVYNTKFSEYIYSFRKFYLQVVFNADNTVVFFAVTSKDKNFHPKIPYVEKELGLMKFVDFQDAEFLYSRSSSKYYEYADYSYLGNPGNYRTIYTAYNAAGIDYGKDHTTPGLNAEDLPARKEYRESAYPNTYGVGGILGDEEKWLKDISIGIDYFTARDLPEHRY